MTPNRQPPLLRDSFSGGKQRKPASQAATTYFCFTAIAEISMRELLTRAAAWVVACAGLGRA
jgi:hypothetical protein